MRRILLPILVITLVACGHDATAPDATRSKSAAPPRSNTLESPEWTAQVLEISPATGEFRGINDSGVAVGTWDGAAWEWKAGRLTRLFAGEAAKINNAGWVIGTSAPEIPGLPNTTNAMLWRNGSAQILRDAGWLYSRGLDVNDKGVVLGYFEPSGTPYNRRAFFWDNGAYSYPCVFHTTEVVPANLSALADDRAATGSVQFGSDTRAAYCSPSGTASNLDPSTPSLYASWGTDINNRGQLLVNRSIGRPQPLAYLWEAGLWTPLPLPPQGNWAQATAMNEIGLVVGEFSWSGAGDIHAFVIEDGAAFDLHQVLDSTVLESSATDVNERGDVVGYVFRRVGPPGTPLERLPVIWRRVTVASRFAGLREIVDALEASGALNRGQANALTSKADAAQRGFEDGDRPATVNQLSAFLNQVDAWRRSGLLSEEQADALEHAAEELIFAIGSEGQAG